MGAVHVGGDVAVRGDLAQAVDGGGEVVLGAQAGGAVGDVAVGPRVACEAGDLGEPSGRALIERLTKLVCEGEGGVGAVRVSPDRGQGEAGLAMPRSPTTVAVLPQPAPSRRLLMSVLLCAPSRSL